jgi:hypothetical protein
MRFSPASACPLPAAFLTTVLALLLTACAPKNPLAWTVKAKTPEVLSEWWEKTYPKLPPELATEVNDALLSLNRAIPRGRAQVENDHYDPVCKRLDGLTLREVLVESCRESNKSLLNRVIIETNKLQQMTATEVEGEAPANRRYREEVIAHTEKIIAAWKEQIAKNDARIQELQTPAPQ